MGLGRRFGRIGEIVTKFVKIFKICKIIRKKFFRGNRGSKAAGKFSESREVKDLTTYMKMSPKTTTKIVKKLVSQEKSITIWQVSSEKQAESV